LLDRTPPPLRIVPFARSRRRTPPCIDRIASSSSPLEMVPRILLTVACDLDDGSRILAGGRRATDLTFSSGCSCEIYRSESVCLAGRRVESSPPHFLETARKAEYEREEIFGLRFARRLLAKVAEPSSGEKFSPQQGFEKLD